ncbi:MAG TPA: hypothetical protein VF506_11060 [Streptosporangiaceae bacterium]
MATTLTTSTPGLVIAADGVRSAVRGQLFPAVRPFYSGSTSWRAVIEDDGCARQLAEVWGPCTEFGALRVSDREMYWFGYFRNPQGAIFDDELAAARSLRDLGTVDPRPGQRDPGVPADAPRRVLPRRSAARFGADLRGGWRQSARNTVMRIAPAGPLIKAGAPITRWTAPA